jgi:N-acetylmuramoyl-L-alanine amidase
MPRYPNAHWRPLGPQTQARMSRHDIVVLHTMVGTLWGTDSYFMRDGYGGVESHFGVGHDGEVLQWQDTDFVAEANLNGNRRCISIETADTGPGFPSWTGTNVPAWTDAQIEAIAQIIAWCCRTHDIPCELIPDTKPNRRGIGYHRQGIRGSYPDGLVSGGEVWSTAVGKVCPGDRRVAQVPRVISRARQLLGVPHPSTTRRANVLENYRVQGSGTLRLNVPVGSASLVTARAWLSASVNGPQQGSARVWFQDDDSGIGELAWTIPFSDGRSARRVAELPDGTTMINIQYDFPDGGCLTLEGLGK